MCPKTDRLYFAWCPKTLSRLKRNRRGMDHKSVLRYRNILDFMRKKKCFFLYRFDYFETISFHTLYPHRLSDLVNGLVDHYGIWLPTVISLQTTEDLLCHGQCYRGWIWNVWADIYEGIPLRRSRNRLAAREMRKSFCRITPQVWAATAVADARKNSKINLSVKSRKKNQKVIVN